MFCTESLGVSMKDGPLYFVQKRRGRSCLKGRRVAGDVHSMFCGPQLNAQTHSSPLQVRGGHDHDATDLALRPGWGVADLDHLGEVDSPRATSLGQNEWLFVPSRIRMFDLCVVARFEVSPALRLVMVSDVALPNYGATRR